VEYQKEPDQFTFHPKLLATSRESKTSSKKKDMSSVKKLKKPSDQSGSQSSRFGSKKGSLQDQRAQKHSFDYSQKKDQRRLTQ